MNINCLGIQLKKEEKDTKLNSRNKRQKNIMRIKTINKKKIKIDVVNIHAIEKSMNQKVDYLERTVS